jgi:molybdopterin converting factor small subunit
MREVIEELDRRYPGLKARLCEDDRLRPGISVAIDSRISSTGLTTPITPGAEVQFLPAVTGG